MPYNLEYEKFRTWWKRARPSTQGFRKCYQAKTPSGDSLQLEANIHEGIVKLQLEPANEKGACYSCTIKKGTIIREREVNTGVSISLKKKFEPFKSIFSALPDEEALKCIGGVYGILWLPHRSSSNQEAKLEIPNLLQEKQAPLSFLQRIFLRKTKFFSKESLPTWKEIKDGLQDSALGFSLGGFLYYHFFDFMLLGWVLAFYGVLLGGVDWVFRKRRPQIFKVLVFLGFGSYFFYTGYTLY